MDYRPTIAITMGDPAGIGPEVIEAGCRVLESLSEVERGLTFSFQRFDWGSDYYRRHGRMMPEDGLQQLRPFDAIYFGAVGDPHLPDDVTLWGLRLAICQGFDQYANVRPARLLPGVVGPLRPELGAGIDWVIDQRNPLRVYLDDRPLLREGDLGRPNTSGETIFEVNRAEWPALYQQGVRVVADRAAGIIRFSMDTRRIRTLMGLPVPPGAQNGIPADPEITADYTPGTLRLTRSPQSATGAVGFLTRTFEPSWYQGVRAGDGRPVAAAADRSGWSGGAPRAWRAACASCPAAAAPHRPRSWRSWPGGLRYPRPGRTTGACRLRRARTLATRSQR